MRCTVTPTEGSFGCGGVGEVELAWTPVHAGPPPATTPTVAAAEVGAPLAPPLRDRVRLRRGLRRAQPVVVRRQLAATTTYELRLLHHTGYRPHLHHCAVCQELLTEEADRFSVTLGGVLCPRDRGADRAAFAMGGATFRLLRYLQSQPIGAIEALRLSPEVRGEAERLLRAYLRHLLERDLKSVAFLEDAMRAE